MHNFFLEYMPMQYVYTYLYIYVYNVVYFCLRFQRK